MGLHFEKVFKTKEFTEGCALHNDGRTMRNKEAKIITRDGRSRIVSVSSSIVGTATAGLSAAYHQGQKKTSPGPVPRDKETCCRGQMSAKHYESTTLSKYMYAKLLLKDKSLIRLWPEKMDYGEQAKRAVASFRGFTVSDRPDENGSSGSQ
jgi:hypothetical protein